MAKRKTKRRPSARVARGRKSTSSEAALRERLKEFDKATKLHLGGALDNLIGAVRDQLRRQLKGRAR